MHSEEKVERYKCANDGSVKRLDDTSQHINGRRVMLCVSTQVNSVRRAQLQGLEATFTVAMMLMK